MCVHHSLQVLLVGVAFANADPVWFYSKGVENAFPSEDGCSSFTKQYDPYTGHTTYRCNTGVKNTYQSVPNRRIDDKDSDEDDYLTPDVLQSSGRSRNSYSKPRYQSFTSERFQMKNKNNKPKRPFNTRRNQCPPGQMFQSELDICIDYPIGPPLPPSRPNKSKQTMFDRMMGDTPLRVTAPHQMAPSSSRRHRCPPGQMFQSELDICIDYSFRLPLPPKRPSNSRQIMFDRMLGDAPVRAAAAHQRAPASVRKYNLKNRCRPNEFYLSELDICVLKNIG